MIEVDTMRWYTLSRLNEWGRVFALHRDCDYLGHASKNWIQVWIEHKGEPPPPNVGFKPFEVSPTALQTEQLVYALALVDPWKAIALRAYYCGRGRKRVERMEIAQEQIDKLERERGNPMPVRLRHRSFAKLVEDAEDRIKFGFQTLANAA